MLVGKCAKKYFHFSLVSNNGRECFCNMLSKCSILKEVPNFPQVDVQFLNRKNMKILVVLDFSQKFIVSTFGFILFIHILINF